MNVDDLIATQRGQQRRKPCTRDQSFDSWLSAAWWLPYSTALTMSSTTFLASPKTIIVLSM